jgi:hypothetical protein
VHRRSELSWCFEQRHVRHSRFPSISSLPVVCVEVVVRARLTSVLLQVTSATHIAKLSFSRHIWCLSFGLFALAFLSVTAKIPHVFRQ